MISCRQVALLLFFCLMGGCGLPSFLITPVPGTRALKEQTVQSGRTADKIAIIEVEGLLLNARTGGFLQPGENDVSLFIEQLERAEHDPAVKAVVLRVNSPGGTVSASDVMYENLLRFRKRSGKTVVASAQDMMTSGAYYLACGADKIVAQPTSVLGSIGVIFQTFEFSGTMEKIGASSQAIKSGILKDMGSPFRMPTTDERQVMQGMVNDYFSRFQEVIRRHRRLDDLRLADISDGRVFTGEQGAILGITDRVGFLEDAIDLARELAGAPGAKVVMYKRPYGYTGTIYAKSPLPPPQANVSVLQLNLPPSRAALATGFYYLWSPG